MTPSEELIKLREEKNDLKWKMELYQRLWREDSDKVIKLTSEKDLVNKKLTLAETLNENKTEELMQLQKANDNQKITANLWMCVYREKAELNQKLISAEERFKIQTEELMELRSTNDLLKKKKSDDSYEKMLKKINIKLESAETSEARLKKKLETKKKALEASEENTKLYKKSTKLYEKKWEEAKKKNNKNEYKCSICFDRQISRVLLCGHPYCTTCTDKFKNMKCPYCKQVSQGHVKFFIL